MKIIWNKIKSTLGIGKIIITALIIVSSTYIYSAMAVYNPGTTLNPSCTPGDSGCTLVSPLSVMETIALSGDVSGSGITSITSIIADNAIEESMFKAVDTASDEECLTYESTTGDFEWQSCGSSYTASGNLLDLTGTTFSINEGTLTNNYFCTYESGTGIECNTASAGGINYFTEGENTSSPNNTIYVDYITANSSPTDVDFAIIPKGTGSILADIPDNTATGGNKRGVNCVDLQMVRTSADQVASGDYGVIAGGSNNKIISGVDYSVISGGYNNRIENTGADYSAIGGGDNNSIKDREIYSVIGGGGANVLDGKGCDVILGGYNNAIYTNSSYSYAIVGGGYRNSIYSDQRNAIVGGYYNSIITDGVTSIIGAGAYNKIASDYSGILAGSWAKTTIYCQYAQSGDAFSLAGDSQRSEIVIKNKTTDATETELLANSRMMVIPNDSTWHFTVMIAARRTDADNESAGYIYKGVIDNNAGSVSLVGSVNEKMVKEDITAWSCAVTANDTNNALAVKCTGQAGKTINWLAKVVLTQVSG